MRSPQTPPHPVHVIGASGRSGRAVCQALALRGTPVV
ncbi:MAG: NADH-ubiquinone oxidoreductase, partial [Acetobacter fabarum]